MRAVRQDERLGLQRVLVELVEVAFESEFLLRPDAFQALDELAAAAVAFGVVEPPLADGGELGSECWLALFGAASRGRSCLRRLVAL